MAQIDWSGIRAAAVVLGVREAARQASRDFSPPDQYRFVNRALQRSHREGWIRRKHEVQAAAKPRGKLLSSKVINGSDSLATRLADDAAHTRVGFSKAARKVATHLGEKSPKVLIDKETAQSARNWTDVASKVHGWDVEKREGDRVMINVAILGQ